MKIPDSNDLEDKDELQELLIVDRELSGEDYEVLTSALSAFSYSPINPRSRKMGTIVRKQKKVASDLLKALSDFSRQLVVTSTELSIIKNALSYFSLLQTPMNATIDRIMLFKKQQDTALALLDDLEE
ncbi:MAG: hypothetical protein ACXAEU_23435 [Candidatus Hodarchaeales archaeon]|jgi:hypothetical protein